MDTSTLKTFQFIEFMEGSEGLERGLNFHAGSVRSVTLISLTMPFFLCTVLGKPIFSMDKDSSLWISLYVIVKWEIGRAHV